MKRIVKAAKAMTITFLAAFIIYLAYAHPRDWQTTAIVAVVLIIVIQLFYRVIHVVKLGESYSIEFGPESVQKPQKDQETKEFQKLQKELAKLKESNKQLSNRIDKTNGRISKLHPEPEKLTFDEALRIQMYTDGISTDNVVYSGMGEGSSYDSFCKQIAFAKENNVQIENSPNYRKMLDIFLNAICNHLIDQLASLYGDKVNSFKDTIKRAFKQYPYSKKTLLAVRDDLVEDYGKRSQCTLLFDEVTNKLDRMY